MKLFIQRVPENLSVEDLVMEWKINYWRSNGALKLEFFFFFFLVMVRYHVRNAFLDWNDLEIKFLKRKKNIIWFFNYYNGGWNMYL